MREKKFVKKKEVGVSRRRAAEPIERHNICTFNSINKILISI
jgi:hypothetical protein